MMIARHMRVCSLLAASRCWWALNGRGLLEKVVIEFYLIIDILVARLQVSSVPAVFVISHLPCNFVEACD